MRLRKRNPQGFDIGAISSLAGSVMSCLGMEGSTLNMAMGGIGAHTVGLQGGNPMDGFWQGYNVGALNHTGDNELITYRREADGTLTGEIAEVRVVAQGSSMSSNTFNGIGALGEGMENMKGTFRMTNGRYNGNMPSFKYYESGWRGGSQAQITTYSVSKTGKNIEKFGMAGTVAFGGYEIYQGVQMDGGTYGYNAQHASAEVTGGAVGSWSGAIAGAAIGSAAGPWGTVIGGIVGGVGVGWMGSYVGGRTHNMIVR